MLSANKSADN